jgi:hypothetical protein
LRAIYGLNVPALYLLMTSMTFYTHAADRSRLNRRFHLPRSSGETAMIKLRVLVLACGVTLAVLPVAGAQDKGPTIQKKQVNKDTYEDMLKSYQQGGGSYRFVSGDETLTSGDLVTIARKGAEGKVTGVFVYADPKTNKLYVRPKAGQAPVSIPAKDIDKIERISPAVGSPEKGGIKPAIEFGDKPAPKYEIHTMTVRNGTSTSTFYYDNSLSPAERDQLGAMERASNDLVQKSTTIETLRAAMENAANDSGTTVVQTAAPVYPSYIVDPYYYPYVGYYNAYYYPDFPLGTGGPYWGLYGGLYGVGYYGGASNTTVVVRDSGNAGQSMAALAKSLSEAQAALNEAQKNYTAMSRRGIYDPSGHIVAVRLEE